MHTRVTIKLIFVKLMELVGGKMIWFLVLNASSFYEFAGGMGVDLVRGTFETLAQGVTLIVEIEYVLRWG